MESEIIFASRNWKIEPFFIHKLMKLLISLAILKGTFS
ncbi:hypothetical protein NT08PM_0106 [Pasteurella multocida subsp. multocida str. 3480]|nr:hypothetical protein NT08PM_0106 [Pasteurella multocida subsp. multocida str. 3480]